MARPTRPATADEALRARDEVQQRIEALIPEVARLKVASRAAAKAHREAHHAWVTADIQLGHYRRYLYSLATGAASGTLVMPLDDAKSR
jgi:uncharacterized small protein (DUF1192 family)